MNILIIRKTGNINIVITQIITEGPLAQTHVSTKLLPYVPKSQRIIAKPLKDCSRFSPEF